MANLLTQLELEELSLVDVPANPGAMVSLFKRDSGKEEDMTKMETVDKADYDKVVAENERLRKALIDNEFVIKADAIEKKAPVETIEVAGEMINKADIPAPVLKALEDAKAEKEMVALEKRAEETLPHFSKDVAVALLKNDLDEKIIEALKAADAAFEAVMMEKGNADAQGDLTDPLSQLNAQVQELAKSKNISKEKAFADLAKTKDGKALIGKAYAKESK
jgi:hypothetical protein